MGLCGHGPSNLSPPAWADGFLPAGPAPKVPGPASRITALLPATSERRITYVPAGLVQPVDPSDQERS